MKKRKKEPTRKRRSETTRRHEGEGRGEKEGAAVEEERRIKRNFWGSLFPEAALRRST